VAHDGFAWTGRFRCHRRSAVRDVWVGGQLRVHAGVHAFSAESTSAITTPRDHDQPHALGQCGLGERLQARGGGSLMLA
jgi:hypothetical protein